MRLRTLALTVAAGMIAAAAPATASAGPPSYMDDELPVCLPIPVDYTTDQNDGASPECLNHPDDGHPIVEPSTLKVGQVATVTWSPGAFREYTTVGGWYYGSREYPDRMRVGRRNDEDYTQQPIGFLEPVDGDVCFHADSCEMKLVAPYSTPLWPGYYRAEFNYSTTESLDYVGRWDAQLRIVRNVKPQASFVARRVSGLTYELDGRGTTDDTGIAEWDWNVPTYPDASPPDQAVFTHTFPEPGRYFIRLMVFDAEGEFSSYEEEIVVGDEEPGPDPEPTPSPSPSPDPGPPAPPPPSPPVANDLARPPAPPAPPAVSPLTGLRGLPAGGRPSRKGVVAAGRASNPPTAATEQKLVVGSKTLAAGKTTIAAGKTAPLRLKLTRRGRGALKRKRQVKATLVVTARSAGGAPQTTRRAFTLKRR